MIGTHLAAQQDAHKHTYLQIDRRNFHDVNKDTETTSIAPKVLSFISVYERIGEANPTPNSPRLLQTVSDQPGNANHVTRA